jgi:hypothetical protein
MWYNKLKLLPTGRDTIKKKTEINFNLTERNREMGVLSVPFVKSCHSPLMAGWFACAVRPALSDHPVTHFTRAKNYNN